MGGCCLLCAHFARNKNWTGNAWRAARTGRDNRHAFPQECSALPVVLVLVDIERLLLYIVALKGHFFLFLLRKMSRLSYKNDAPFLIFLCDVGGLFEFCWQPVKRWLADAKETFSHCVFSSHCKRSNQTFLRFFRVILSFLILGSIV